MESLVLNGDCIIEMGKYPDNYFDAIVTDPPYGLGKEPDPNLVLKDWIEKGYHEIQGKGFMGKEWDAFVPQPNLWKEVFRVLKPGGHVLAFYGTRTYDWGVMAMRFAGFEVRDCIQWLYGSGFPKSHNISKAIDKLHGSEREVVGSKITGTMNNKGGASVNKQGWDSGQKQIDITAPATEEAKKWDGWGSALKPANEPIVLARKPLEKGLSIAENVLKWGTGGINIDGCRVGVESRSFNSKGIASGFGNYVGGKKFEGQGEVNVSGRFPANIILTHHPECECKGLKKVKAISGGCKFNSAFFKSGESNFTPNGGIGDENGEETIEDWNCHPDCPIKILDEQSGIRKSNGKYNKDGTWINNGDGKIRIWNVDYEKLNKYAGEVGGASRFFYVAKASKSERNKGLEGFEEKIMEGRDEGQDERNVAYKPRPTPMANVHPTVKPVKLMQYLVRLITPSNGIVLDPFCGSGTTGIACKLEKFSFVGIEQDAEYTKIAEARIKNTQIDNTLW
jgi:site-specific DNA-methyltransferase (adenine-specific)